MPSAVKLISPMFANLHPRLRHREIEIAKKLQDDPCDYLIRTLDVAETEGQLILVMELADGSLAEALAHGMVEREAVAALQDIAAGVRELHQLGIIHRDLKPHNILRHGGKWKLADFGIAHDTEVGTQTYTFAGGGTAAYLAPELFEPRSPTVKSDLYALGCIAFELVMGKPLFPGPGWEDYRRQHTELIPPDLPAATNPALRRLVIRLLNKKPEERPQDARDVVERLGRIATPLSSAQQNLLHASAEFASKQLAQAAKQAAERAEAEHRKKVRAQAIAELRAICEEGLDAIQMGLPDVTLADRDSRHKKVFIFEGEDARLEIQDWQSFINIEDYPKPGDPLITAGEVTARNRRSRYWAIRAEENQPDYPVRLANIVAEVEEGYIVWRVYRFRCRDTSSDYRFGPKDREHGLKYRHFFDHRKDMHSGWIPGAFLTKSLLTPDSLVELYAEALALPPDAYSQYEWVGL